MDNNQLGRLEKVELREAWKTEAGDFTPWLAGDENIALLGETIGIELEVEAQEKNVGPFRADILCKDTVTNNWVLIENQLERTDHNHLGQLMTYAAGLDAVSIVWIAKSFTEEHRAAIDWLNSITDDTFNFFGLEVELWKIGNSPVAPKFNLISKPNDWTRTVSEELKHAGELTETNQLRLEYWAALRNYILSVDSPITPQKPLASNAYTFRIGRSYFKLVSRINNKDKIISAYLQMDGPDKNAHFHMLFENKSEIEKEIGEPLFWRALPEKKESQARLQLDNADPADKSDWPRQHKWLLEKLEKMHRAFSNRVKKLDASDYVEDEGE